MGRPKKYSDLYEAIAYMRVNDLLIWTFSTGRLAQYATTHAAERCGFKVVTHSYKDKLYIVRVE